MNASSGASSLRKTALAMVLLNAFTTSLTLSASNVALPAIAEDLNINAATLGWVPMAFLMAAAMFALAFGRIADMFGRKRIFLVGTTGIVITSLLAALSPNGAALISARFLQGVSAAMLYATQIAIISSVFPPKQRGRAIGMTVSMIYMGLSCGPLCGGFLIDLYGWRASFIFQIPLAFIVLFLGFFKVKEDWRADERGAFDVKGAFIYGISILLLCLGLSTLPGLMAVLLLASGAFGIWRFVKWETSTNHPIFDMTLFINNRIFTYSCCASFIIYTAIFANVILISFYTQYLKQISATTTGVIIMIQPLTMAFFSTLVGRLSDRIEPRLLASIGMSLTAVGLLILALLNTDSPLSQLITALMLTGLGFGLFSSPNISAIMGASGKKYYGSATSSIATARILGQMSSMALVALVFSVFLGQVKIEPEIFHLLQRAISICFFAAAGLCVPGIIFSLARGRVHQA